MRASNTCKSLGETRVFDPRGFRVFLEFFRNFTKICFERRRWKFRFVMSVANDCFANVTGIVVVLTMFFCSGNKETAPLYSHIGDPRAQSTQF